MTDDVPPDAPTEGPTDAPTEGPAVDVALRGAVLELEKHASGQGWDQPAQLFALVLTEELLAAQPELAPMLELDAGADLTGSLTPVEQEALPAEQALEELLTQVMWPQEVHGCAVIVERLVLPPSVADLPEDAAAAQEVAAAHPEREEVRMVAAATRAGSTYCALRLRSHDEDRQVLEGPDLVPALLELLQATLATEPVADEE